MQLLEVNNLKISFEDKVVLDIPEFKLYKGDKIGVIGANGSGKSTLLNILYGSLECDAGNVKVDASISYCKQFDNELMESTIREKENEKSKMNTTILTSLSEGEKKRLQLVKTFADDADVYFFDEPTSNLDYKGILWVKKNLTKLKTFLLVSHDRNILNECCNKIIEIVDSRVILYEGNYDDYECCKELMYKRELFEYQSYEKEKKRLQSIYYTKLKRAKEIAKKPKDSGQRIGKECGSKSFSSKAKNMEKSAQAALKKMEMLEKKNKPKELFKIKIDFHLTDPPRNRYVIQINDLSFGYDSKLLFEHANMMIKNKEKIAILGDNGVGKTTLLNLIVNGEGSIKTAPSVRYGYFKQEFKQLDFSKSVLDNVMCTSIQKISVVRTILARLLFKEESLTKKVELLSGGEKTRLAIAKLIVSKANILILDEPTNYLDIISRKAVEDVVKEYEGTIILVSHDINFVNAIATKKVLIKEKKIVEI